MALPLADEERDQLWNPALPGVPGRLPPMPPAVLPPAAVPAALPSPVAAPAPPQIDRAAGMEQPKPHYKPDLADYIYGALAGFTGNLGASQRELRWRDQQDRQRAQQQDRDRLQMWMETQKGTSAQQALRQQALDAGAERLKLQQERQAGIDRERDYNLDPNDPSVQRMRSFVLTQAAGRLTPEEVAGMSNRQLQAVMTMINREAERAHAGEDTRIAAQRAGATSGASTAAREAVQLPYDVAREERSIDVEGRKGVNREAAKRADVGELPGAVITNRDVYTRASTDGTSRRDMEKAVSSSRKAIQAIDDMIAIRQKHGTQPLPSAAQSNYDNSKSVFRGQLSVASETGTLQSFDIAEYAKQIPEITPGATDALSLVSGKDVKLEQLKGLRESFVRKLNSGVERWGIEIEGAGGAGPRKPKPAADDGDWEDL